MTPLVWFRCAAINKGRIGQSGTSLLHTLHDALFSTLCASPVHPTHPKARQPPCYVPFSLQLDALLLVVEPQNSNPAQKATFMSI